MLPDYREIERKIDDTKAEMERLAGLSDKEMPAGDRRDRIMAMSGQVEALEAQARQLRDHEVEQLQAAGHSSTAVLTGISDRARPWGGSTPRAANTEEWAAVRSILSGKGPQAALSTSNDTGGGYLIPPRLVAEYMDIARKADPILADAEYFDLSGGNAAMELPEKQAHGAVTWAAETADRPETDAPEFGDVTLNTEDVYGYYWGTRRWFDSVPNSERIILDELQASVWEEAGVQFAVGDNVGKPKGLFTNHGDGGYEVQLSSTANALDAAQFLNALTKLKSRYLAGAAWYMNGATLAALLGLAMPNMSNTPLVTWQADAAYILGHPVKLADSAPNVGNGAYPVAFGDLSRAYAVGSHVPGGMWLQVDTVTAPQLVKWYGLGRIGGTPHIAEACVLLKSDDS
jgi:HK97 family phage major capsid protein